LFFFCAGRRKAIIQERKVMNPIAPNTRPEVNVESAGEELNTLLGAFFQQEMPKPWPAFSRPSRARTPQREPGSANRVPVARYLALALTLGLLFLGIWAMPQTARESETTFPGMGPGHALPPGRFIPKPAGKIAPQDEGKRPPVEWPMQPELDELPLR
jgi:hypothetical protein